ncbi:MAG: hypothetical protein C6W56_01340 [Caldibacillus debilis]|nr:MAG: hypothetical protein C6W56_01340 [Caldibacillus debilis]
MRLRPASVRKKPEKLRKKAAASIQDESPPSGTQKSHKDLGGTAVFPSGPIPARGPDVPGKGSPVFVVFSLPKNGLFFHPGPEVLLK